MRIFDDLNSIVASKPLNADLQSWKNNGGRIMGWLCTYIPEEILYAADILPIRLTGCHTVELGASDGYLYSNSCSMARNCLEVCLNGGYDFLDGLVAGTTCDHMRRLFEVWKRYLELPFAYLLSIPHKMTEQSQRFYLMEAMTFKSELEAYTGRSITDAALSDAIRTYNRSRKLLLRLNELRKDEFPLISGSEMQTVLSAGMRISRKKFNQLLEAILADLEKRGTRHRGKVRFLLSGAVLDTPAYIQEIENLGALVVADELCTGTSYFWDLVDTSRDPMEAIARRYLEHIPCARMRPCSSRFNHVANLIKAFRVDGVIILKTKFCDLYEFDNLMFQKRLEKLGLPVLELEREYHDSGSGQMLTRVQAFIEMLEGKTWKQA
jgi:benzoyl-CoA reductase subunit C